MLPVFLFLRLSQKRLLQEENEILRNLLTDARQSLERQMAGAFEDLGGAELEGGGSLAVADCMLQLSDHASLTLAAYQVIPAYRHMCKWT